MAQQTDLSELLKQLDNERFYQDQGLQIVKKKGVWWSCKCPFCNDPDHFSLNHNTGAWKCFKCPEKGNQVTFYVKMRNCTNAQAVKEIKRYMGIQEEDKPVTKNRKNVHKTDNNDTKTGQSVHEKGGVVHESQPSSRTPIYERLLALTHLTEADREHFHKKRGFSDQTIEALRFRSGGPYIADLITQLQQEFSRDELTSAGLLVEVNGTYVANNQLLDERLLIPYLDKQGLCYHLRPHKLGFKGIPNEIYCRRLLLTHPEHIVITEGEFKAAALLQWGIPAIAIPGVSSFGEKNLDRLVEFLKAFGIKKVTVIFDSEEKGNPDFANFKEKPEDRYDTQYWSYMNAYLLNKEGGFQTRVGWLPAAWRENGKIDFDGALAQGKTRAEIEKVIADAKTPKEFKESLEEEASRVVERKISRHFAKQHIKRDFNKYVATRYTAQQKAYEEVISNFVINIKSSFFTPSGVIRNVELVNQYGESSDPFPLEPGAMAGVNEFKKFLLSKGNYLFYGSAKDLTNIWDFEFLRDTGDLIWMPEQIGRVTKNIWLFGNLAIKDGKVYKPDENGIIWIDSKGYKPQSLELGPGGEPKEDAIPSLVQRHVDIKDIAEKMRHSVGGYEAYMAIGWVIASIFSKEIFETYKCVPILFPHGKRESGKSTVMRWIMNFFGIETEGVSVGKTTTQNYVARVLSYYSSLGIWFDEYRNENGVVEKDGLFRSAYNRQLSGKGTATAFQAKGFAVHATLAISGEELPRDNGLFTRCIPVQISAHKRNRDWFDWLNSQCSQFSGFTYDLLLNYNQYKKTVMESIAMLKSSLVKRQVTDRTAENWAICAGSFWALVQQDINFIHWVETSCQEMKRAGEDDHMLNQFWDDVNFLLSEKVLDSKHFKVEDYKLYCWFEGVYVAWAIHYRKKSGRDPFDKMSILKYLSDEPYYKGSELRRLGGPPRRVHVIDLKIATETITEIAASLTGNDY